MPEIPVTPQAAPVRVACEDSAKEGLGRLRKLRVSGEDDAVVLSDQRMPGDLLRGGRLPSGWSLERTPLALETSMPGVFAAGDVRHRSVKRVASAVGEGSVSIRLIHEYLG